MPGKRNPEDLRSLYDPAGTEEEDLWFIPAPFEDELTPPWQPPWQPQRADAFAIDPAEAWTRAQAECTLELARAAAAFGAFDDRLRQAGAGARRQAVLMHVAELSWHLGDRLTEDRISLYLAARLTRAGDAMQAFARTGWAFRRLMDGQGVRPETLADLLGRAPRQNAQDLVERPQGDEFNALTEIFWERLAELRGAHSITRACVAWDLWHKLDLSGDAARMEGAVVAAKIGAEGARGGAGYLPFSGARSSGQPAEKLKAFYAETETQCLRALMRLDQVSRWQSKAREATSTLSGRTPARLLSALAEWPVLSAEAAEHITGASRAAVQRNLDKFAERDLVRELTGHERFRMWAARI